MSETTTTQQSAQPVASPVGRLSVMDVIKPRLFGDNILGQALAKHAEEAGKQLVEFARRILSTAQAKTTALAQRKADLEVELKKLDEQILKIERAAAHTEATNNVFALAAAVEQKSAAIAFAQSANIVVPSNDDPIWSVPAAE